MNNFVTCTVEGVSYVATSRDNVLMPFMYLNHINWASRGMKRFHELAQKYYGTDDSTGYFLDLGANIGTTGIYFLKNIAPNLKLLAVEPDPENFKLLRTNLILNDLGDDKATIFNCGLGDKFDEMTMYMNEQNPGRNSVVFDYQADIPSKTIKIMPLDDYLAEKNIAAQDVKYIWIDTEGFEAQVLLGAKNLLAKNPLPIFVEFNLDAWRKSDCFEEFFALLAKSYSHFIHFTSGKETLYPLDALRTNNTFKSRGDIFLIKAGAELQ